MATMRIKEGDPVQILRGKDRGKRGRVIEAHPRQRRVIVEDLNVVKRHPRPRRSGHGRMGAPRSRRRRHGEGRAGAGRYVMVVCPICNRPTRVGVTARTSRASSSRCASASAPTAGGDRQ